MAIKKTIAILGATGKMGSAIAGAVAGGNYRLLLFSRDAEKAQALAAAILKQHPGADIAPSACPVDASWEADIIIPAVPYAVEKQTVEKIRDVATQKIVISISNPFNATYNGLQTAPGSSAALELQQALPHSKVVKAFNTAFSSDYAHPVINGQKIDGYIAGNDEEALAVVSDLVAAAGFEPRIVGGLEASITLELMTLMLIGLNKRYGLNRQAGWKVLERKGNRE